MSKRIYTSFVKSDENSNHKVLNIVVFYSLSPTKHEVPQSFEWRRGKLPRMEKLKYPMVVLHDQNKWCIFLFNASTTQHFSRTIFDSIFFICYAHCFSDAPDLTKYCTSSKFLFTNFIKVC